jgi:hypothetical protein
MKVQLLDCPLSFDAEKALDNLKLELTDLQSDKELPSKVTKAGVLLSCIRGVLDSILG